MILEPIVLFATIVVAFVAAFMCAMGIVVILGWSDEEQPKDEGMVG